MYNDVDSLSMLLRDYDERSWWDSVPEYTPWERGMRLFRYGREEPGRGKGYLMQWCDSKNVKYRFPFLSTSLLHLSTSNLGKVFTILDACRARRDWWMSDRVGNNLVARVQMPDMQAVQFQVLNIFFSAILCGLPKLVLKSNSVDEEFLWRLLLWWTIRMIYVKVLLLSEQMKSVGLRIGSDFVRYWFYCSSGEEKKKVSDRRKLRYFHSVFAGVGTGSGMYVLDVCWIKVLNCGRLRLEGVFKLCQEGFIPYFG